MEVLDHAVAPSDGVGGASVGLEDDGRHGLVAGGGVEGADDLENVADAEEAVGVEELALLVGGEVGCQGAVRPAPPPLVLAGRARLRCGGGRCRG